MGGVTEADARFLDAVRVDVERLVGPGVVVDDLAREDAAGRCRLVLRYHLGRAKAASEGVGETVVDAHAALRHAVVIDRVSLALRAMIAG